MESCWVLVTGHYVQLTVSAKPLIFPEGFWPASMRPLLPVSGPGEQVLS